MKKVTKAILLPLNKDMLLIQDRENHRPPRWGFFGGSVEEGESVIDGLIRETKEELGIDVNESDVNFLGKFVYEHKGKVIEMHTFIFQTEIAEEVFNENIQEGKAAKYMNFLDAAAMMRIHSSQADVDVINALEETLK